VGAPTEPVALDPTVQVFVAEALRHLGRVDDAFAALEADGEDLDAAADLLEALQGLEDGCSHMGLEELAGLAGGSEDLVSRRTELPFPEDELEALLDLAAFLGEVLAEIEATGRVPTGYDPGPFEGLRGLGLEVPVPQVAESGAAPPSPGPAPPTPAEAPVPSTSGRAPSEPGTGSTPSAPPVRSTLAESKIRVDVGLLDSLMNQVGELVLSRNQLLQHVGQGGDKSLSSMTQRLSQITSGLQENVMLTRLQPIDSVWSKFPRLVRDLARSLDKEVTLRMEGGDTELDRTLLEAIRDPLTHLARNAIDHGIESPEDRERAGKPRAGTLLLTASHHGGQVSIEIVDDGGGIDADRILQKAVDRELVTRQEAASLTDSEKLAFIFEPGFSTAEKVTNISGRGVGMDVVRSNIEQINGLIDIESSPGQGTRVKLRIPLTLAIMPALMVVCAGDRYAIPQASLLAVVRLTGEQKKKEVEHLHSAPVYRWRGRLIPLVFLRDELKVGASPDPDAPLNFVVLQAEDRFYGLVVDEVSDSGEIVVKSLGERLSRIPLFAGATIMEDGLPALILDVLGLAQHAEVLRGKAGRSIAAAQEEEERAPEPDESHMVLVVHAGGTRMAVEVEEGIRMERFLIDAIEMSGDFPVVQYRGGVVPLLTLPGAGMSRSSSSGVSVVMYHTEGRPVGFLVDEFVDVVRESFEIRSEAMKREGIRGTALIQGQVTEMLDLEQLIHAKAESGAGA
jgi:two-component system chemotaxis sensor kinase CheA